MAAANALYLASLCLPAQDIARCRSVCRLWRGTTCTELFRRRHRDHCSRTPMPLFFFQDPEIAAFNLRAVDIRGRVSRPVVRFARSPDREMLGIRGSCAGILLLSCGDTLYACNPCTRRWARLPPLHLAHDIIGFYDYATGPCGDSEFRVLYNDREDSGSAYWIFTLGTPAPAPRCIGSPGPVELQDVLAYGIAYSYYSAHPFFLLNFLHWLPPPTHSDSSDILIFDTVAELFSVIPLPTIQVRAGEDVPVVGDQLFEIDQHLAMTLVSLATATIDIWVRSSVTQLWSHRYRIRLPGGINGRILSVLAVAQGRNHLVECPHFLLQCSSTESVLQGYQLAGHFTILSGYTIEESLLLRPSILPMRDADAVDGDPPFFPNH
jgi:hypothetical protein